MLFPQTVINKIAKCAYRADRLVRADLIEKYIISENDYTSNFTSAFRREINSLAVPGLKARIQLLNGSAERSLGADACVIFENDKACKVGIFEAKWPRLSSHVDCWDSKQKATRSSHFDSQLLRQHQHLSGIAIWEMFYCEYPFRSQPSYMPDYGSACVWHYDAISFTRSRSSYPDPWRDKELQALLETSSVTIVDVIDAICNCYEGVLVAKGSEKELFGDLGLPCSALIISYDPETASKRRPAHP